MLRLLGRASSVNLRKVLWTGAEIGLAFEREDWGAGLRSTRDRFTHADIVLGLSAHRWLATPIERPALSAVSAWYARLAARPDFVAQQCGAHP